MTCRKRRRRLRVAAEWFLRNCARAGEEETYLSWLDESPQNLKAYEVVREKWARLDEHQRRACTVDMLIADECIRTRHTSRPLRPEDLRRPSSPGPAGRTLTKAFASVISVFVVGGFIWAFGRFSTVQYYDSAIGQQKRIQLSDGSVVLLNTNSRLEIRLGAFERYARLVRGEALFSIAKDSRVFIVKTPQAELRVLGTQFNVNVAAQGTDIAVLEGRVQVGGAGASSNVVLSAGKQALITLQGEILPDQGSPLARIKSWPQKRLTVRDEPLGSLVNELNRYRKDPIVIADSELVNLKVSGSYELNGMRHLFGFLSSTWGIRVDEAPNGMVILRCGPTPGSSGRRICTPD